jgi:hypothetical protein
VAYGLAVSLAAGLLKESMWLNFALLIASTVMMAELNNTNALIRIYSRMVSCSFLVMTSMSLFLFRTINVAVVQITFITFLLFLLRTYQRPNATGLTFYAFCALGMGSIVFPQVLLFLPALWIVMAVYMQSFSPRVLLSTIFGIITPYWFVVAWLFYTDNIDWLGTHFLSVFQFGKPFFASGVGLHEWLTFGFVLLCAIIGGVHFAMYSYQDRIRIRMIYELFIILNALTVIFAILQPRHFDFLLGMSIVLTAPLIGHWLALTHTRLSNIVSMVLAAGALALTVFNLIDI